VPDSFWNTRIVIRPATRTDLLTEPVGDGAVVYDTREHQVHALDGDAARVWRALDGRCSVAQLAEVCGLSEAVVANVLLRLDALDLLAEQSDDTVSRRVALRRLVKLGGAAMLALPLITTVAIPTSAAMAYGVCTTVGQPCAGFFSDATCTTITMVVGAPCGSGCTCVINNCIPASPYPGTGTCN
jgi:hypothetical protein